MKIKLPNGDTKQVGSEGNTWEQRTLEKLLLEVYKQQQRANLWKWLWRGVWVLLFLSLIAAMMGGKQDMGALGKAHTAVIDINGTIDSTNDTATKVIEGMEAAYKVKNVKGIILRANSPMPSCCATSATSTCATAAPSSPARGWATSPTSRRATPSTRPR